MNGSVRLLARLDVKNDNVVKGIHLEGLRTLGKPAEFAKFYYQSGIDELLFIDVVASLYGRSKIKKIISQTAKEVFIPLTVGGGIRTLVDIKEALRAGADKVAINTAAIKNPKLISTAANIFGSSTITVSVEAGKAQDGEFYAFCNCGRETTGKKVEDWIAQAENLGAGEILLTSIDKDGTGDGFDWELIKKVMNRFNIPIVISGGAGKKEDLLKLFKRTKIHAAALASLLHYQYCHLYSYSKIAPATVLEIKSFLVKNKINCRI